MLTLHGQSSLPCGPQDPILSLEDLCISRVGTEKVL
jgi:hypothetical protein